LETHIEVFELFDGFGALQAITEEELIRKTWVL
jgi:hypothetical protein